MALPSLSRMAYFYPRPPRGGRPRAADTYRRQYHDFYPRPPRGGRLFTLLERIENLLFLSPPSARRATASRPSPLCSFGISIPALREEGDGKNTENAVRAAQFLSPPSARRATSLLCLVGGMPHYFYPRPPRGGRPVTASTPLTGGEFLSPPSARRATY